VNIEEMRGKAREDLVKAGADAREQLFKKRYAMSVEAVENSKDIRELRKHRPHRDGAAREGVRGEGRRGRGAWRVRVVSRD